MNKQAVMKIRDIQKKVKIDKVVNNVLDGEQDDNVISEKEYQLRSITMTTDLIKFQSASKLASRDLGYDGLELEDLVKLSIWENDTEFLLKRFELESDLTEIGLRFLGYNIVDGKPYSFLGKVTELTMNPVTRQILELTYQIGETTISGKEYYLEERWTLDVATKKYNVIRQLDKKTPSRGKKHNVPDEYQRDETLDEIQGVVFYNNIAHKSDIENVMHLMKDKGSFQYQLLEKFLYLAPKVFNKSSVMDGNEAELDKKMRKQTFFNITSRAGQFQQPITVFNPTLPNSVIQETIKFYDDQIFMYSLASRPTDSGKQAQTNNLEQSLKNELANNYIEFKRNLRNSQFTKYMLMIAKELGISTDENTFKVNIELTMTQERQLDPTIDGDAAQAAKTKGGE